MTDGRKNVVSVSEIIDKMLGEKSVMEENTQVKKEEAEILENAQQKRRKEMEENMSGSDFCCWLPFS